MKAPADLCSLKVAKSKAKGGLTGAPTSRGIAVALGLPQLKILWQKELERHFEVTVIYRRERAICPRCGKVAIKEHDRRPQRKQDRRLRDKVVFLADEATI